jgi:hypothetical protein
MNADAALALATRLLAMVALLHQMIESARSEGRDLNDAELDQVAALDDAAKVKLQAAIDAKRAG